MNLLARFAEYAAAFEKTYADDDWSRLDAFVSPDVVYRVVGSPGWDCKVEGRANVYAAIKRFLDGFDRRLERRVSAGPAAPIVDDRSVRVAGQAAYRRGDSEELVLEIELATEFRDGMIVGLSDLYSVANQGRTRAWLERHGEGLDPSYV